MFLLAAALLPHAPKQLSIVALVIVIPLLLNIYFYAVLPTRLQL